MRKKSEVITFKADKQLIDAIKGIENRSKFIREALLAALDNVCPLCHGTGILSVNQKVHWDDFIKHHSMKECDECHEQYLVCNIEAEEHSSASQKPHE